MPNVKNWQFIRAKMAKFKKIQILIDFFAYFVE